jgi:drug/metabolite transporter (DMT)-like permease
MVAKLSVNTIDPTAITFWRLVFAVALMSTFVLKPAWRNRAVIVSHLPRLVFLGLLGMALFQCLAFQAAKTTTTTSMAIITSLVPLLTMLLSVSLRCCCAKRRRWACYTVAFYPWVVLST